MRDRPIAGVAKVEWGQWRSSVQLVFDPATRAMTRRTYSIWDVEPSRELVFEWSPDYPVVDKPGRINDRG